MSDNRNDTPTVKRRWRPIVVGLAVVVPVALVASLMAVYAHYADPAYIRSAAEQYMQQFTTGRVTIGRASFSWFDGIRLYDVALYEPESSRRRTATTVRESLDDAIFTCPHVRLETDLIASMLGKLTITSVVATAPTCSIVRNSYDGSTNLAGLIGSAEFGLSQGPLTLPTIELRDARVRVIHRTNDRTRIVDEQILTVRGRPTSPDSPYYDIVWQGGGTRSAQGCTQVDLRTGRLRNVFGGLPWMSLEAVMIAVNAEYEAAGAWSDLLGLHGIVRAKDYDFSGSSDDYGSRSATIELEDAALSIPIDEFELELAADKRYLRFENVFGSVTLTAEGVEAVFRGKFHGSRCEVSLRMRGGLDRLTTLDDVGFTLHLRAEDFELPQYGEGAPASHRRFVDRWAPIRRFYDRFDPHGRVDLEIDAEKRAGADSPVVAHLVRMTARDASASYRKFPYRVSHLTGAVEFSSEGVFLRHLKGRHTDGEIEVNGWLSSPNKCAEADITIEGDRILIDDSLIAPLPVGYRKINELFHPQGRLDLTLRLRRGVCQNGTPPPWVVSTRIGFEDLSAVYAGFPTPVKGLKGSLQVDGKRLAIREVKGQIEDGLVTVAGDVRFHEGRVENLMLSLSGHQIPIREMIISALPDSMQRWVRPFHLQGHFDIDMKLVSTGGKLTHRSEIQLDEVVMRHDDFAVPIEDINGTLILRDGRIETHGLTGRYRDADLNVDAASDLTGDRPKRHLTLRCQNLLVDDALSSVVPEGIRAALSTWRVETPVDVGVTFKQNNDTNASAAKVYVVVRLKDATVRHARFPLPLEFVRGDVIFDGEVVKSTGVRARYGGAEVSVDFRTSRRHGEEEGTISINAVGLKLDASLLGIMPDGVRMMCDRLGLSGKVNLHLDRLHYVRTEAVDRTVWKAKGSAELIDVALADVGSIRDMWGSISFSGTLVDPKGGTMLEGEVRLAELELMGRRVVQVNAPWSFVQVESGMGRFALDAIRGRVYGGGLTGRVEVDFDDRQTDYLVTVAVDGMDIEPFVNVGRQAVSGDPEPVNLRGRADARVHLSGTVGDPTSRRGRGQIKIKDGHLFRLPIMLAILHVINLSVPDESAFDEASADFYFVGQRMNLETIRLRGNALALDGSGTLMFPDLGLDLELVNVSPNQWARIPGLTDFIEETAGELVALRVRGPLYQPRVTARPLPGLSDEFKLLFKRKKPKKMRAPAP